MRLCLFGPVRDGLLRKHFAGDSAISVTMKYWFLEADSNFYEKGDADFSSAVETMCTEWSEYVER
jgi:hypothetical protein